MEKVFSYITKNLISVLGIAILTGTTLTTSALGVMKVANNFDKVKLEVPEVREAESNVPFTLSPTPKNSGTSQQGTNTISHPKGTTAVKASVTGGNVVIPTSVPSSNSTLSQTSTVGCTITLFGKQYDVTNLRNTHSGGNIFNCGTDMTGTYQARHGTDLSRMQQYLISSSGGTTSSSNSSSGSSNANGNTGSGNTTNGNPQTSGGSTSSGSQSGSGSSSDSTSSNTTHHDDDNEGDHIEEREIHNEDHEDEVKVRTESYLQMLLKLIIS